VSSSVCGGAFAASPRCRQSIRRQHRAHPHLDLGVLRRLPPAVVLSRLLLGRRRLLLEHRTALIFIFIFIYFFKVNIYIGIHCENI
jgi:hypothetical protein